MNDYIKRLISCSVLLKKKNALSLCIIIIIHTIMLFLLCDFHKTMATYGDELLYYGFAKSMFNGEGTKVHGVDFDFQNKLYSFVLMPFFYLDNVDLRIRVITLLNSFLMSACVVPIWLICKELKLSERNTWLILVIMCICPDMINAGTFMAENLYWVLALFVFWGSMKVFYTTNFFWRVFTVIGMFLAYLCKEVALCMPLSFVVTLMLQPLCYSIIFRENEGNIKCIIDKKKVFKIVAFIFCFILICLFYKIYVSGGKNVYDSIFITNPFVDKYCLFYFVYAFFYYIISSLIAFFIIPVIFPAFQLKEWGEKIVIVWFYAIVILITTLLCITFTIAIREHLGETFFRIHLRYYAWLLGVFLPIFFRTLEIANVKWNPIAFLKTKRGLVVVGLLCCLGFKGVKQGCINERLLLDYTFFLSNIIQPLQSNKEVVVRPACIIISLGIMIWIGLFLFF